MNVTCKKCGATMVKKTLSSGNCRGILLALAVFALGATLIVMIPPYYNWIVGGPLCLVALFTGGIRRKIWLCKKCGASFDRA